MAVDRHTDCNLAVDAAIDCHVDFKQQSTPAVDCKTADDVSVDCHIDCQIEVDNGLAVDRHVVCCSAVDRGGRLPCRLLFEVDMEVDPGSRLPRRLPNSSRPRGRLLDVDFLSVFDCHLAVDHGSRLPCSSRPNVASSLAVG